MYATCCVETPIAHAAESRSLQTNVLIRRKVLFKSSRKKMFYSIKRSNILTLCRDIMILR